MESEQSELYIPDSMNSFTAYFQNQRLCSRYYLVYHSISFN